MQAKVVSTAQFQSGHPQHANVQITLHKSANTNINCYMDNTHTTKITSLFHTHTQPQ